jgi:hypothetical protein
VGRVLPLFGSGALAGVPVTGKDGVMHHRVRDRTDEALGGYRVTHGCRWPVFRLCVSVSSAGTTTGIVCSVGARMHPAHTTASPRTRECGNRKDPFCVTLAPIGFSSDWVCIIFFPRTIFVVPEKKQHILMEFAGVHSFRSARKKQLKCI